MTERLDLVKKIRSQLKAIQSEHEAEWIVDFAWNKNNQSELVNNIIARRLNHEPLAYIFGEWAFREFTFFLGPGVLIPRPETEELIEIALKEAQKKFSRVSKLHIADLGSGTGVIGISFAIEWIRIFPNQKLKLTLVEKSPEAFSYLKKNIERHLNSLGSAEVEVFLGSWTEWSQKNPDKKIDVLLSNPPYLSTLELESADIGVKDFEPHEALVPNDIAQRSEASGPFIELIDFSKKHLTPEGFFLFERGAAQNSCAELQGYKTLKDLAGKERFIYGGKT